MGHESSAIQSYTEALDGVRFACGGVLPTSTHSLSLFYRKEGTAPALNSATQCVPFSLPLSTAR